MLCPFLLYTSSPFPQNKTIWISFLSFSSLLFQLYTIPILMDDPPKHLLTLLKLLQQASKDLHSTTHTLSFLFKTDSKPAIDALSELETKALPFFSTDPNLRTLSHLLSSLRTLIEKLDKYNGYGLPSLLRRQITLYKISQVASSIDSEIQSYIDRVTIQDLVKKFQQRSNEDEQVEALVEFERRLSQGFDLDFQDLILRAKVFTLLEKTLIEPLSSKRVREEAAMAIAALVQFNKNVFVGLVMMGPTIKALIEMASTCSIRVLSSLIRFIRSPLVDEILSNGEIPNIVRFLGLEDLSLCAAALDCVLELAYIGRREVIEEMLQLDLVKILVDLQRRGRGNDVEEENREKEKCENCDFEFPFDCCVSKFAIQLEVGEGLTPEEKREFKLEILRLVKEASLSDAEFATISAEILWGSSP